MKTNKHFLADKVPLVVASVIMLAGSYLPGIVVSEIIGPFYNESNAYVMQILWCVGSILISFLLLILFERWFRPEYDGSMKLEGLLYGLKLSLPVFIFWTVWMAIKAAMKVVFFYPPDLEAIVKGLRPGINEEIVFRGIAAALLLR